jgi:hypothetical protein
MAQSLSLQGTYTDNLYAREILTNEYYIQTFRFEGSDYIQSKHGIFIINKFQEYDIKKRNIVKTCEQINSDQVNNVRTFLVTNYIIGQYINAAEGVSEVMTLTVYEPVKSNSEYEKNDTKYISLGVYEKQSPIPGLPSSEAYLSLDHFTDLISNSRRVDLLDLFYSTSDSI